MDQMIIARLDTMHPNYVKTKKLSATLDNYMALAQINGSTGSFRKSTLQSASARIHTKDYGECIGTLQFRYYVK